MASIKIITGILRPTLIDLALVNLPERFPRYLKIPGEFSISSEV